jgi:hypothetical protein
MSGEEPGKHDFRCSIENEKRKGGASEGPSVLLMCAYLLGLASIPVVVIGGQFPWFTLAPAIVLLMGVHVRRVEAKFRRRSPSQLAQN